MTWTCTYAKHGWISASTIQKLINLSTLTTQSWCRPSGNLKYISRTQNTRSSSSWLFQTCSFASTRGVKYSTCWGEKCNVSWRNDLFGNSNSVEQYHRRRLKVSIIEILKQWCVQLTIYCLSRAQFCKIYLIYK